MPGIINEVARQRHLERCAASKQAAQERRGARSKLGWKPGYVYLIEGADGYYKIGRTKHPDKRIDELTRQAPFPLKLLHIIEAECMIAIEAALHERFRNQCSNREWFRLTPQDIDWFNRWELYT